MSKVCQITGRKRMIGNNVAHSKLRTKRDFSLVRGRTAFHHS